MIEAFNRTFNNISEYHREELKTLEREGCIYARFWQEDLEEFRNCRIQFEPTEIVQYVEAMSAYDEFLEYKQEGYDSEEALEKISNEYIRSTVNRYNEIYRESRVVDADVYEPKYFPAAFFGVELESLVTGGEKHRYEYFQESYTGDRRFLLSEIIQGFPQSYSSVSNRSGNRPDYEITCEQDVQDLFFALIKPIFPDARREEYTPKHATKSKRIDFVIPELSTVVEVKYVRDSNHASDVSDELKIDIESYHRHADCNRFVIAVWDEERHIIDRPNFEKDLSGQRSIDGVEFHVEVNVIP